MKCTCCGAEVTGRFCEYCGTEAKRDDMPPVNNGNAQANNATSQTIINNYYNSNTGSGNVSGEYHEPAQAFRSTIQDPVRTQEPLATRTPVSTPVVQEKSSRSKSVMLILWFFLGVFGVHHFYAGRVGMGVLYLCTAGLCGIGWVVDIILLLTNSYRDGDGKVVV